MRGLFGKAARLAVLAAAPAFGLGLEAAVFSPALAQAGAQGPVKAGVITLSRQQVPITVQMTGQAAAREQADIRPLVDGIITKVLYQYGQEVQVGTPLFQIDERSYRAALASAEAELESARAAVPAAETNLKRYQRLAGTGVTQADLDTAEVTLRQAQAAVAAAEAAVDTAQINLDRTTITSPIDGVAGIADISVGDLVTSGQSDALAVVTGLDPIFVDVSESSARVMEMRARLQSGQVKMDDELDVRLTLENGQTYTSKGKIVTLSSTVSTTTGTIRVRFEFDNPDHEILPGMFLRVAVNIGSADAFLVPQLAGRLQADGRILVWTVDAEGKAEQHLLKNIGSTDTNWIISDGLEDGEKLMVDKIGTMRQGTEIAPVPVTIQDGIVTEDASSGTGAKPAEGN